MTALLGWILAALLLGLYLGERARRRDALIREGVVPVPDSVRPAQVRAPGLPEPDSDPAWQAAKEKFIADAVAEGHSDRAAAAEFDRLYARAHTDEQGTWGP